MEHISEQYPSSFSLFNADTKDESTQGRKEPDNQGRARTQSFGVFCFVFLDFSTYEEMVLLWAENVDLNMSRTSYALLEQYEWQLRQKRKNK